MKRVLLILISLVLFACGKEEKKEESLYPSSDTEAVAEGAVANLTPEQKMGQEIFDGKGNCFTCHKPEKTPLAPGIIDIAKIYKEKKGDMVKFLKEEAEPIVDPSQYPVMKTNFYITKTFSDEELKALEAYIYSHLE